MISFVAYCAFSTALLLSALLLTMHMQRQVQYWQRDFMVCAITNGIHLSSSSRFTRGCPVQSLPYMARIIVCDADFGSCYVLSAQLHGSALFTGLGGCAEVNGSWALWHQNAPQQCVVPDLAHGAHPAVLCAATIACPGYIKPALLWTCTTLSSMLLLCWCCLGYTALLGKQFIVIATCFRQF